jgi:murein DD-endopeptidase MepM/ murein hydrolase activator NlpD
VVVLSFLYVLKWREEQKQPEVVAFQTFSPEHNRYNYLSNQQRFRHYRNLAVSLPVMGQWFVKQGHNGAITHREGWRHAWDFVIRDARGKEYQSPGDALTDYYCYSKPVVAPADGTVVEVIDFISDNPVGETNLDQNWGNSLIIDHGYDLYSQLSHLQPGTFQVERGQRVWKGQEVARCGNSGRSPEPHLHYQLQTSPQVGAPTYEYPIALYLSKSGKKGGEFHFFDFPGEGEYVQNLQPLDLLKYAFYFVPGKRLNYEVSDGTRVTWECQADMQNNLYIECRQSKARAYLKNNGYLHYFTAFEGDRQSLLYHFYLAHYKVALNYYDGMTVDDIFPLHQVVRSPLRWLQDLLCPFVQFMRATYRLTYQAPAGGVGARQIQLSSTVHLTRFHREARRYEYRTLVQDYQIERFEIIRRSQKIIATWLEEE